MFTEPDTVIPVAVWDAVLDALDDPSVRGCLSIVGGDGLAKPSKAQWSRSSQLFETHRFPAAVVASHRITRAMVTASSWSGASIRAYRWAELGDRRAAPCRNSGGDLVSPPDGDLSSR